MFKTYGIIGIILIILVEINFFLKIQPFANWYFPTIWLSYILVVDALVYKIRRRSLISDHFYHFVGLFVLSVFFWYIFEFFNVFTKNWIYIGIENLGVIEREFLRVLSFSTVLPALFETTSLVKSIKLFNKIKLRKSHKISKTFIYVTISIGILCFFLPVFFPKLTFPLIWLSFFFILDPINYINNQPSILGHLKNRNLGIPIALLLAGIILGFFWEFWNYYATVKWVYDIPFIGFFKIFEMPVLGYLGYFPFAFELYAMYWFVRGLFVYKDRFLID